MCFPVVVIYIRTQKPSEKLSSQMNPKRMVHDNNNNDRILGWKKVKNRTKTVVQQFFIVRSLHRKTNKIQGERRMERVTFSMTNGQKIMCGRDGNDHHHPDLTLIIITISISSIQHH